MSGSDCKTDQRPTRRTAKPRLFMRRAAVVLLLGSVLLCGAVVYHASWLGAFADFVVGAPSVDTQYGTPRRLCNLASVEVRESSGLAASQLRSDVLWTHNDSGDEPRIFAFDLKGRDLGAFPVRGAEASDWEDMASFHLDGIDYLLLADVGNNHGSRKRGTLYLVEEPRIGTTDHAKLLRTIHFHYSDGRHNCEAVGFDPVRREFLLVTKVLGLSSRVYLIPWPDRAESSECEARPIGTIRVAVATAMDVSPDGLRAIVLTYGDANEYVRAPDQDWEDAFAKPGHRVLMPSRRQGESICYGHDGRTLYLTSESRPTPLFEIRTTRPTIDASPRDQ